ncbi:MAG: twin-arginine translocase subunit TatC, partial [Acidobacteriota bacterium]
MAFPDEPQGAPTPIGETALQAPESAPYQERAQEVTGDVITAVSHEPHSYSDDWSSSGEPGGAITLTPPPAETKPVTSSAGGSGSPPKPPDPPEEEDDEEGMARMSFLEHLEELRKRLILALGGVGVSFILCLLFSDQLWDFVRAPASSVLTSLHVNPPVLRMISPMDGFQIMWMKIPLLFSIFLSSPWVLYQVWAFISPGLYKKEKRYAVPFVVSSAGLFVAGGLFAYFVAFRFGLQFLLSMGLGKGVEPGISLTEYYDV